MAGQQLERGARLLVGQHETAEADVVARGVLDATDDALLAEAHEHVDGEVVVDAHGHVVGVDGHGHAGGDHPEVLLDLRHVVEGVERGGDDDGVGAEFGGALAGLHHAGGRQVGGTHEHGHAAGGAGDGATDDLVTLGVGQVRDLAGGTEHEQAVHAAVDQMIDDAVEAVVVDRPIGVHRGNNGGNDATQLLHVYLFFRGVSVR